MEKLILRCCELSKESSFVEMIGSSLVKATTAEIPAIFQRLLRSKV